MHTIRCPFVTREFFFFFFKKILFLLLSPWASQKRKMISRLDIQSTCKFSLGKERRKKKRVVCDKDHDDDDDDFCVSSPGVIYDPTLPAGRRL